ncbi:RloB family protein [Sphingomonas sp. PAMC 26605]|uniref:RloB family protein n=1 Tax=Sphingomonas sp. PAMC 26605 TaxID=1112214 RepID=UPI00056609F4
MPKPRKPANLTPLKTLRIFCEGAKTEPNYINGYIETLDPSSRKSVVEVEKTKKNTAIQLVEEAIKSKRSVNALPGDENWVVYDRESAVNTQTNCMLKR